MNDNIPGSCGPETLACGHSPLSVSEDLGLRTDIMGLLLRTMVNEMARDEAAAGADGSTELSVLLNHLSATLAATGDLTDGLN